MILPIKMLSFDNLPMDVRLEIFKNYPKYRSLSRQYYNETQKFYELNCNAPISLSEFLYYLSTKPEEFTIYGHTHDHRRYDIYHFTEKYLNTQSLFINDRYNGVFNIASTSNVIPINNVNEEVHKIFASHVDMQYDIKSMYAILLNRHCENIKRDYIKNYIKNHIHHDFNIDTLEDAYQTTADLYYYDKETGQKSSKMFYYYSLMYNAEGKYIGTKWNQYPQDYETIYNHKYDYLMMLIDDLVKPNITYITKLKINKDLNENFYDVDHDYVDDNNDYSDLGTWSNDSDDSDKEYSF